MCSCDQKYEKTRLFISFVTVSTHRVHVHGGNSLLNDRFPMISPTNYRVLAVDVQHWGKGHDIHALQYSLQVLWPTGLRLKRQNMSEPRGLLTQKPHDTTPSHIRFFLDDNQPENNMFRWDWNMQTYVHLTTAGFGV